jgi:hypothetical protein
MDSLLEALKTGTAFNREQKRKRAPRAAGGKGPYRHPPTLPLSLFLFNSFFTSNAINMRNLFLIIVWHNGKARPTC